MYFLWSILIDCVVVCTAIQLLFIFHVFLFLFHFNFMVMLYYSYTLMFSLFTALLLFCCVSFCSLLDGVCLSGNKTITYLLTLSKCDYRLCRRRRTRGRSASIWLLNAMSMDFELRGRTMSSQYVGGWDELWGGTSFW